MDFSQGRPSQCRGLLPIVCCRPDAEPASELREGQARHGYGGSCYRAISGYRGRRLRQTECVQPELRDRVLLVGDAGGFVDPLTGEGIYGALLSGQAAASAILSEMRGEGTAAEAFAGCLGGYRQTLRFSSRAATAFYADPARGFRAMRLPFVRRCWSEPIPMDSMSRAWPCALRCHSANVSLIVT